MNSSVKLFSALFALVTFLSSCNGFDCVNGSGNQITQTRDLENFTEIETSGSIRVILKQGTFSAAKITADDNLMDEIKTFVNGNRLVIDLDGNFCDAGYITVHLTAPTFEGVEASGAVEISSEGKLNVNNFYLDLSGSSKVVLDLNAADVRTESSGASEISLRGQAGSHLMDLSGSTTVDAVDFVVGKYRIENSGSSESKINVLNELDINSSGSSEVQYRGNPSKVRNDNSGSSSVNRIN